MLLLLARIMPFSNNLHYILVHVWQYMNHKCRVHVCIHVISSPLPWLVWELSSCTYTTMCREQNEILFVQDKSYMYIWQTSQFTCLNFLCNSKKMWKVFHMIFFWWTSASVYLLPPHAISCRPMEYFRYHVSQCDEHRVNCCRWPVVCGVTSLGYDHLSVLGNTIEEIAWNKAGIFKVSSRVSQITHSNFQYFDGNSHCTIH